MVFPIYPLGSAGPRRNSAVEMKWQALWRKYTTEPKHRIRIALIAALLLALTVILVRTAAPNFAPF